MQSEQNQRRSERFDVKTVVKVSFLREGRQSTILGEGCNFSKGGMCLFLTLALPPGTPALLDFLLPYTSTPMIVRGVVRNERGVNYGVEFVALTPYQQEVLERNCKVFDLLS
jgi:hypothetical protein